MDGLIWHLLGAFLFYFFRNLFYRVKTLLKSHEQTYKFNLVFEKSKRMREIKNKKIYLNSINLFISYFKFI